MTLSKALLLVAGLQYVAANGRRNGFCRIGGQITSDFNPQLWGPQPLTNLFLTTPEACYNECVSDYGSQYVICASLFGPIDPADPLAARPCYCQLNTQMEFRTATPIPSTTAQDFCWSPLTLGMPGMPGMDGSVDTWTDGAYPAEDCGDPSYGCRTDLCGTNVNSTCCGAFDGTGRYKPVCTNPEYISVPAGRLCSNSGQYEIYKCCLPGHPGGGTGDPHLHFAHGGRADVRGKPGALLNFLSARNVSLNVRMSASDFHWSKRLIHGTHIDAAFWTLRTSSNKLIKIAFESTKPSRANVTLSAGETHERAAVVHEGAQALTVDNIEVVLAQRVLTVTVDGKWTMQAAVSAFPFAKTLSGESSKRLLDVSLKALYDADKDVVGPHGVIGQSYDGDDVAVFGALDTRSGNETTTIAQGEGAIEGVIEEYMVDAKDPYSTEFKYTRFDKEAAPHRDVSKLTGKKASRKPVPASITPTVGAVSVRDHFREVQWPQFKSR